MFNYSKICMFLLIFYFKIKIPYDYAIRYNN